MAELRVSVVEEPPRGLVRMSRRTLADLGLQPGDTVSVGARTHGRAMPAAIEDGLAQIDPCLAWNAGHREAAGLEITPVGLAPLDAVVLRLEGEARASHDQLRDMLFDMPLSTGDRIPLATAGARQGAIGVASTSPGPAGVLGDQTALTIEAPPDKSLGYEGLGGLTEEIERVHEMIAAPLLRPELFERLGIPAPRGVLFSGPPGSGKTLLARAVAGRTKAAFFHVNAPEIVTKHYGESEAALRKTFAAAAKSSPAIIFIDEIDAIAPARAGLSSEKQVERRIVAQLLTLMDGLSDRGRIVVMAATNRPDALDPALRRPGRFDREIRFRPPDAEGRAEILRVHLAKAPLASDIDLAALARDTHGYVGADLAALAREAAVAALARSIAEAGGEANVRLETLEVTQADLLHGLAVTAPSTLRGMDGDAAPVPWESVGGLAEAKAQLERAVIRPHEAPDLHRDFGIDPPRGVLLTGPPGTGKTLLARALAHRTGMNFIPVRPPRLLSQFFGEAERAVAEVFDRARLAAPTLLFFDEFDAVAPRRGRDTSVVDRIVAQFLMEMDGLDSNKGVIVVAATNRPGAIDPALTRPGRLDLAIEVPLPDRPARRAILDVHLAARPLAEDADLDALAAGTEGLSGADLAALARAAARLAVGRALDGSGARAITAADLDTATARIMADKKLISRDFLKSDPIS